MGPAADLDALRATVLALIARARADLREQGYVEDAEREPDRTRWEPSTAPIEFGDGLAVTLLRGRIGVPTRFRHFERDSAYVGVRTSEGWWGCLVGTAVDDMSVSDPVPFQWVPGGAPELSVHVDQSATGSEEGVSNTMGEIERVFIGYEGARPVVYGSVFVGSYYDDSMWTDCAYGEEDEADEEDRDDEDYEDPCQDDPSPCCELQDISTRDSIDWRPGTRPGWIRAVARPEEGAPMEPAPPSSRELELARLGCRPPRD